MFPRSSRPQSLLTRRSEPLFPRCREASQKLFASHHRNRLNSNQRKPMLKRRNTLGVIAISLVCMILTGFASIAAPQSHHKPSRDESTKAIRATAYSMMKAFLTQDVSTFKRLSAKRTLQLVSLTFEAA